MVDHTMTDEHKAGDDVFATISKEFSTTDIRTVYKFVDVIGGGHFGTVRRVHPKSDPQVTYAVKSILRADIAKDIKLLEEELFILRQIDHPNIVKFH
jgi:serine/threonine protein kinase